MWLKPPSLLSQDCFFLKNMFILGRPGNLFELTILEFGLAMKLNPRSFGWQPNVLASPPPRLPTIILVRPTRQVSVNCIGHLIIVTSQTITCWICKGRKYRMLTPTFTFIVEQFAHIFQGLTFPAKRAKM